jgi:hypothetical protein
VEKVTVALERVGDRDRWVRVTLSLCACDPGDALLSYRDPFAWGLESADPLTARYGRLDWEEVVRGAIEAVWRPFTPRGVRVTQVQGSLGLGDREGLALACILALRRLVGGEEWEPATSEWRERSSPFS